MNPRSPTPHVFGPVPSRRLGRSLGVDVVPFKACSYDCVYCQLGPTTHRLVTPQNWFPVETVLAEVKRKLDCRPDYLTLSGSGEPTLYAPLAELIAGLKKMTDVPVAVLTNGSLLWQPAVRRALLLADVVIPSLDAGNAVQFRTINRPHPDISFDRMVEGLVAFRREFRGQFWLEIMLLNGFTSLKSQITGLVEQARRLRPDKIQLNTVVRPPTEAYAQPVPEARLRELAALFPAPTEIITTVHRSPPAVAAASPETALLALLRRRPCTVDDVTASLGLKPVEVFKWLEALEARGDIVHRSHEGETYYQAEPANASLSARPTAPTIPQPKP